MKRFVKKSFFFILPVLSIFICMEFLLRDIPNDYKLKKEYLDKYSGYIEILCLGSSHAYYGINPVFFSKNSFNGSHISQTIDYDLQILKKYENKLENLKYILIPISYFTLYSNLNEGMESWRVKNYSLYYNIHTSNNIKDYSEVLSNDVSVNIKRLYSFYIQKKQEITCSQFGFGLNYSSNDQQNLINTGIAAANRHKKKDDLFFNENIGSLSSIIQLAQKNKSVIIFFTPPAYYTYREKLDPDQLEKTAKAISKFTEEYNNAIYKNYMYDKKFSESDFYDADHLNEIGAEKLTKSLNNLIIDIEKYGLYCGAALDGDSAALFDPNHYIFQSEINSASKISASSFGGELDEQTYFDFGLSRTD
jgi:hypothetical protein